MSRCRGPAATPGSASTSKTGEVSYERTDRGWIAYLNDLHKGRNTGAAWSWFIDIFAVACDRVLRTGLILLQLHAHRAGRPPGRWSAWVSSFPLLLLMFFIH